MENIELPGLGLPVNYMPGDDRHFPILLGTGSDFEANTLTNRELCMLRFIEEITNKPDWWIKVYDEMIVSRWKTEALEYDWGQYLRYGDFTAAMADACIKEMKLKAAIYQQTNLLPVYDYTAAIVKSDHLIPNDMWHALKQGVKVLEDIPASDKDWHPGSDGKVLNLVHPSMYPLVYGKSRVLHGRRIGLAEALGNCGQGFVIKKPSDKSIRGELWHCTSTNFQWLPCDVSVDGDHVKIESYINNLHPVKHADLYSILEKFIKKALPAWDVVYRWPEEFPMQRLRIEEARVRCRSRCTCANAPHHACTALARPTRDDEPHRGQYDDDYSDSVISDSDVPGSDDDASRKEPFEWRKIERTLNATLQRSPKKTDQSDSEYETEEYDSSEDRDMSDRESEDEDDKEQESDANHVSEKEVKRRDMRWFYKTHPAVAPEPSPEPKLEFCAEDVKSMGFFHNILPETGPKRLQVIVKLANIHLTPENPNYPGGSWHTEGQINEHICSTALFYYDNENITDSYIDFRTVANAEKLDDGLLSHEQNDWKTIQRIFAIEWPGRGCTVQSVGSVLTREKRALFFPNVFQHHVNSFKLADPTKPGHRKIMALFLVDPAIPVISTANVPPQRQDWWPEDLGPIGDLPFDEKIAKEFRKELMEERSANEWRAHDRIKRAEWNFCEH